MYQNSDTKINPFNLDPMPSLNSFGNLSGGRSKGYMLTLNNTEEKKFSTVSFANLQELSRENSKVSTMLNPMFHSIMDSITSDKDDKTVH